jgi:putative sigma-54 modulation protein
MSVPRELRGYVEHIADRLRHFFDGITSLHLSLRAEKERRVAELVVNVSHGAPVVAKATTNNLYAAIHMAAEKVETQLRKHKDKIRDHRPREADKGTVSPAGEEPQSSEPDPAGP